MYKVTNLNLYKNQRQNRKNKTKKQKKNLKSSFESAKTQKWALKMNEI